MIVLLFFFDSSNSTIYIYINRYIERLIDSHIRKVKRDRNKKRKRNYVYTIIIANGGKLQTIDGWYHRLFRINPFRYSDCFWINWEWKNSKEWYGVSIILLMTMRYHITNHYFILNSIYTHISMHVIFVIITGVCVWSVWAMTWLHQWHPLLIPTIGE